MTTTEQTLHKLSGMRMHGFSHALQEQLGSDEYDALAFEDRVAILIDREWSERESRSLTRRLSLARFRDKAACVEDIDYRHPRGLDRTLVSRLSTCEWIRKSLNLLITGSTGCGKTFIACALGHKACRDGHSVLYRRVPRLLGELEIAKGDGSYPRLLNRWAKTDLLILDDWGLTPLGDQGGRDILEVLEDRHGIRSTIIASQIPVKAWHKYIGDPTVADAVLDRIVHSAHQVILGGESVRKKRSPLTKGNDSDN